MILPERYNRRISGDGEVELELILESTQKGFHLNDVSSKVPKLRPYVQD